MSGGVRVRPAAAAGRFYPADPRALTTMVDDALARAPHAERPAPKALVVPHAGYRYSGPVAATAYATLAAARDTIRRVALFGPAHFVGIRGLAVSGADALATPLGTVEVDAELRTRVVALPGVTIDDRVHGPEHSLEVQLPFLQRVLTRFSVLPLAVGDTDDETVARVLDAVWGGPETLVVVSSDLSHYLDHPTATARDRATADAIVAGDTGALEAEDACGAAAVRGLVMTARRHALDTELLDLRTSGDTSGDRDRVVGYGAFMFVRSDVP